VKAEGRRPLGIRRCGLKLRKEVEREGASVSLRDETKARCFQGGFVLMWSGDRTALGLRGPRHWKRKVTVAHAHHVVDSKRSAGSQHSVKFRRKRPLVGNVHSNVHHIRAVERSVRVSKRDGVPLFEADAVAESNPRAQDFASLNIFLREVDASYSTTVSLRRESAPSAKTTTNIKNTMVSADIQLVEEAFGCDSSPDMKLIDRPEVFDTHAVDGLA
jgi:hypothetical protein